MKVRIEKVEQYPYYVIVKEDNCGHPLQGNDLIEMSEKEIQGLDNIKKQCELSQDRLQKLYSITEERLKEQKRKCPKCGQDIN